MDETTRRNPNGEGNGDERADQFAFCVALHEAFYGRRPFTGATPLEVLVNIADDRRTPPPSECRAPAWIRRVLDRGLLPDPDQRFPDMRALLQALRTAGGDRAEARRLAEAARTEYTAAGRDHGEQIAEIDAWLADD